MPHAQIHAQIVLAQLGAKHIDVMAAAQCFAVTEDAMHFKIPRTGSRNINYITIILTVDATYSMEGWHCEGMKTEPIFSDKGLRVEDLHAIFKKRTGLDLHQQKNSYVERSQS